MKCLRLLPLLLIPLILAGCETVNRQDRAVLTAHNVPPDVFQKMLYGDPLSLGDVITLSQRGVPSGLIIHYMDEQDTIYVLRKQDIARLRAAGVSGEVIGYMVSTTPPYMQRGPSSYVGYPYGPYGGVPAYPWGPYPYGYYDSYYPGPVVFVGNYGGWWHGGWGGGGRHRR